MANTELNSPEPHPNEVRAEFTTRVANNDIVDIGDIVNCADLKVEPAKAAPPLDEFRNPQETMSASPQRGAPAPTLKYLSEVASTPGRDNRRYGLLECMAQGGMGVIYKVWDKFLQRDLAMKVIREKKHRGHEPSDGSGVSLDVLARFKREAEITARLDHPGVVPIHDLGVDEDGRLFFTMRLVKGHRLDEVFGLSRKKLDQWSLTRALDVIVKICETLAFAHSRGVIHRDLKPANIMVGQFGETYVMDWGLAKVIRGPDAIEQQTVTWADGAANQDEPSSSKNEIETQAGSVLGTAYYMSPEQAAGRIDELDERSDIYSVGVILYELLAGRRPYSDPQKSTSLKDVLLAIANGPPTPIASINPQIPPELVAICEKAMGRRREDRYPTMREMADDLRAYLDNRVVRAYQSGAVAEFRKWMVRNRGTAIAGTLVVLIAFSSLLAIVSLLSRANTILLNSNVEIQKANVQIRTETEKKDEALEQKMKALGIADAERRRSEGLFLARASADVIATNPGLALLLAHESAERNPGFTANRALLAALPLHHERQVLTGHRAPIRMADVSQDGTLAASASFDHTAIIWDLVTGTSQAWLIGHRNIVRAVQLSHRGKLVATGSYDQTAALWNPRTGERLHVLKGHGNVVWSLAFSPDDRWLATAGLDGTVRLWDVSTGSQVAQFSGHTAEILLVAFSPDGASLITGSADRTARLWDVATRAERAVLNGHEGGVSVASFSSDGRQLITGAPSPWTDHDAAANGFNRPTTDKTARIWDVQTGALQTVLEHESAVVSATFGKDGLRAITGTTNGNIRIWNGGETEHQFGGAGGAIQSMAISPDGALVAAGDSVGKARVWDSKTGVEIGQLLGHTESIRTIAFLSPQTLLTASQDGTLRTWNARSAGTIPPLEIGEFNNHQIAISPAGNRIAVRASPSQFIGLYSFPEGQPIAELKHDRPVGGMQYSPDGEFLGTFTDAGIVRVFSAANGSLDLLLDSVGRVGSLTFGPEQLLVVVSRSDGEVSTWKLGTRRIQNRLKFPTVKVLTVSPDGRHLLAWPGESQEAELWDLALGTRTARLSSILNSANDFPFTRFSNDGERLLTWTLQRPAPRIWKTDTGQMIAGLEFQGTKGLSVNFSPNGKVVLVGALDAPTHVWDASDGRLITVLSKDEPTTTDIFSNTNGERVVTSSESRLSRLWNGRTGEAISLIEDRDDVVRKAAFSRNGELFLALSGDRSKLCVWDGDNGKRLALASTDRNHFTQFELGPDADWFATSLPDGSVRIWPVRPAEYAKTQIHRQLTPDEHDLFELGTGEQRAIWRREWNERTALQSLCLTSRASCETVEHAKAVQTVAERVLAEFIAGLPYGTQKRVIANSLSRFFDEICKKGDPGIPTSVALATIAAHHDDVPLAVRLLKSVLNRQHPNDSAAWRMWATFELGNLRRTPREILADFPKSRSKAAAELQWLLERLAAGEPVRIRAGGGDLTTDDGTVWHHDCFFGEGEMLDAAFGDPSPSTEEIQNTNDDALYQSERLFDRNRPKSERCYLIPLPVGRYRVVLHFAETYFRSLEGRAMNILAEDQVVISDYNPLHAGFATADRREFETRVDDGLLDLEFQPIRDNPKVSAIEIYRLND